MKQPPYPNRSESRVLFRVAFCLRSGLRCVRVLVVPVRITAPCPRHHTGRFARDRTVVRASHCYEDIARCARRACS
eukprot:11193254-Lingulodinium_polyedra.AAC.1